MRIHQSSGGDDFAAIHEAVSRRFQHLQRENETMPDVLLIDGGKGQLNAALSALAGLRIEPPIILALAKREELLHVMHRDEPLRLSRHSYALRLMQYVRDEAHRFAQHYHHILRRRSTLGE
jgi:excinuclease ABC subunit C